MNAPNRPCTSPRKALCRPGCRRRCDGWSCDPSLHSGYWLGQWQAPSEPDAALPWPLQAEPWLRCIHNYEPVVRLLSGLSWRCYPHRCTQ